MTEALRHECGLGMIRLRKPISEYPSPLWGLRKMYVLMDKQHNRGQDGAGLASVKLNVPPGVTYLARERVFRPTPPWAQVIKNIDSQWDECRAAYPDIPAQDPRWAELFPFAAELFLGHVRYGTYGNNSLESCHPVVRSNNWKTRTLILAGNFNLTNVDEQFRKLLELGQHPRDTSDTVTVLERIGHFLDITVQELFDRYKAENVNNTRISELIAENLPSEHILTRSAKHWDGGYMMGGLMGHGEMFALRDPSGIRPGYVLITDEVVAVASERAALASAFEVDIQTIEELPPGNALIVKRNGDIQFAAVRTPKEKKSCSFERIYFSRPNDPDIYAERKALGSLLAPQVLAAVEEDIENTVFTYVPNSASIAFRGLVQEVERLKPGQRIRSEQIIWKDTNLRTFITGDDSRNEMVSQVYNVTHGLIRPGIDRLVCIDDSVVRGTTLKQSLLTILAKLRPKSVVFVSSCPQIRYPDCYGIDMSQLGKLLAFQSLIALLKETDRQHLIDDLYGQITQVQAENRLTEKNYVKSLYDLFTEDELTERIATFLQIPEMQCPFKIVFQPLENLPKAIPHHRGDWYFSGEYPTPGGNKVVNQAFLHFYEGKEGRAYF